MPYKRFNRQHFFGFCAEMLASLLLRLKGWVILRRNERIQGTEVDILARRGNTLVVVEVKARKTWASAEMALRYAQSSRQAKVHGVLQQQFPEHTVTRQTIYVVAQWPFVRITHHG